EDFFAFPGQQLIKALDERIAQDDALGVGRLIRRVSGALLSGSYRYDGGEWEATDDPVATTPDRLSASMAGGDSQRPYFETLFVTPAPAASLPKLVQEMRQLRRVDDQMVYESVMV